MFRLKQVVKSIFCKSCVGCCRFKEKESVWVPHLLEQETKSLKIKKIKLIFRNDQFICSFLEPEANLCRIYKIRPFECRLYPFLLQRRDDRLFIAVHLKCPFLEREVSCGDFKDYLKYLKAFFKRPKNLKIIMKNKNNFSYYPKDEIKELEPLGC
ncbi:MAG: YkgJ family cysteine cluster protein [Candidatus Omnitrophica bacterium]|nr:YkgJ family cysteine cluster protein [Candidatus Omnitrophota bacterium]